MAFLIAIDSSPTVNSGTLPAPRWAGMAASEISLIVDSFKHDRHKSRIGQRRDEQRHILSRPRPAYPTGRSLMRVLLVGSGGREHALAWAISASPLCDELICAPGNAGIAQEARCVPVADSDIRGLIKLARDERIE